MLTIISMLLPVAALVLPLDAAGKPGLLLLLLPVLVIFGILVTIYLTRRHTNRNDSS